LIRHALIVSACVGALGVVVQTAKAGPFEEGEAAFNRHDYVTAYRLLLPLAEQGNVSAQVMLGKIYSSTNFVGMDFQEGTKWYRKAAERKNKEAVSILCVSYVIGVGAPEDYVLGHMWCNIAVGLARYPAESKSEAMLRDLVARKMTPNQIGEAQRMAREWLARH
jgi:TPR repeat protein